MKKCFYYICILIIFYQVNSILPDEKKQELLDKYAKIILEEEDDIYFDVNYNLLGAGYSYDITKIQELFSKYNFPSSYNFVEDTNATVHIKNQKSCGCCWAMASTTALAYRFHKKGIEVDLSPQHELSCYIHDCNRGNNLIDSQLTLVKNGTLTEECFPFSSQNGSVTEKCITNNTCKNPDIKYEKYYARNAYKILLDQDNIYNVTAIIIDQLLTDGPVISSMVLYSDFQDLNSDPNCKNTVYTYDGASMSFGGHGVAIVGYGFQDNKYYWLAQNSWGDTACQGGFIKIEFGQAGIGSVSWSQPYIGEKESGKLININFGKIDLSCNIKVYTENNLDNFKNQLNIIYKHKEKLVEFDYICGVDKLANETTKSIKCFYENMNIEIYKGIYEYYSFRVIGQKNNFVFNDSFFDQKFHFYGNDKIEHFSALYYSVFKYNYISETSNRIFFLYEPVGIDPTIPPIYANIYTDNPLKNCVRTQYLIDGRYVAYCDIDKDEYNYFENCDKSNNTHRMITEALCGVTYYRNMITCKIDKNSYPIFKIKNFQILNEEEEDFGIKIRRTSLNVEIEGNVENFSGMFNSFLIIVLLEVNNQNITNYMDCETGEPKKLDDNFNLECQIYENAKVDNYYLLPYYAIISAEKPFEVVLKDIIKGKFNNNKNNNADNS